MVWYSYLLKNFPQFVVIHTVKDFSVINEGEVVDIFLEFFCFFYDPTDVGNFLTYLKSAQNTYNSLLVRQNCLRQSLLYN